MMPTFGKLLKKHHDLDFAIRDRKGRVFYSDWDCTHPFIDEYLNGISEEINAESGINFYRFFEDENDVSAGISEFHHKREGLVYDNNSLVAGDGSTPLISSYCLWLLDRGVKELFYIPPLYYNFYYFSQLLSIPVRPVANLHSFESGFRLRLPEKTCHLVITDPVWYAGISVCREIIKQVREWQERTGSVVFVDGSFQYCSWDGEHREETSTLDPDRTFRLVCPTKTLALHGFRFSYLLLPSEYRNAIRYIFANTHGPTTAHNIRFSSHAMKILNSKASNSKLTNFIQNNYHQLAKSAAIESEFKPDSGYFVFAKLLKNNTNDKAIVMDGDFFEQPRLRDYCRINLLAPDTMTDLLNFNAQNTS